MSTSKNPNPQGKGLVPVLAALADARVPYRVPPKHIEQVSAELFTSLFILSSQFSFKPVLGKTYYLYRKQNAYQLSLIAPQRWNSKVYGQYIGECELQADMSWTLILSDGAAADQTLLSQIAERRQQFDIAMQQAEKIDDVLPVFEERLPFYQRVFASALSSSLSQSMHGSGIAGLSYSQALGLLGHDGKDEPPES